MVNYEKKEIIGLGKEENNYFFDNFFICFIKVVVLNYFLNNLFINYFKHLLIEPIMKYFILIIYSSIYCDILESGL